MGNTRYSPELRRQVLKDLVCVQEAKKFIEANIETVKLAFKKAKPHLKKKLLSYLEQNLKLNSHRRRTPMAV